METNRIDISVAAGLQEKLADEGKTPLYFLHREEEFLGVILAADVVKPTSRERQSPDCRRWEWTSLC